MAEVDGGRLPRPLDPLTSIKLKLGVLVGASVVVAVLVVSVGNAGGVPWWLTVPVSVALALGVTQLLAAGMTDPLRQMTDVAQRMARGDYSGRVRTQATDEVGRLAAAFNRMAEDLAAVDRERRDLIATVSHELRTPLTAMTALLENIADGVVPADEEHLAQALAQAERLRDLVGDLLDLSRLEGGVARLSRERLPLLVLVEECVREVVAAGQGAAYDVSVPEDLRVIADPARLRQLVGNALDNAARHSPAGHPVRVTAGADATGWWLEVADHGPGIPATDRERAFERFGTDPGGGGTGLGLAVARWVAELHGGTLRFREPAPGEHGARLRLVVPDGQGGPAGRVAPAREDQEHPITATQASSTTPEPDALMSPAERFWPEPESLPGARVVLSAAAVGVLAGATLAFSLPGLAWTMVLLAAGAAAFVTARHRRDPFTITCTVLAALLVLPLMLLDAEWIGVLGVLAAAAVFLVGVTRGGTVTSFVLSWLAWPSAAVRGMPWLGRSVRLAGGTTVTPAVVRTVAWSVLGVAVFGLLFASADALFATWVDALVPDLTFGNVVVRGFVGLGVFGLTLPAAYLALNPPRLDRLPRSPRALDNRFEWLAPVLLVDAVFVLFLVAQASAVFGGHDYVERTTGLTYADYVHQGFGQLTVATALTLLVVWAAARWAGNSRGDVVWLRAGLGLLCALTLVVVASALYRMHVYQEAYGFTTVRLTVDVFEGWLGVVVLAVMVAGVARRGVWLPRIGLLTGAVALLGLAAINPDAWVAERNIDRYEETGDLDVGYLQSLSADAAPVIADRLPRDLATCMLRNVSLRQLGEDDLEPWTSWNLGRQRADAAVDELDLSSADDQSSCDALVAPLGD